MRALLTEITRPHTDASGRTHAPHMTEAQRVALAEIATAPTLTAHERTALAAMLTRG